MRSAVLEPGLLAGHVRSTMRPHKWDCCAEPGTGCQAKGDQEHEKTTGVAKRSHIHRLDHFEFDRGLSGAVSGPGRIHDHSAFPRYHSFSHSQYAQSRLYHGCAEL